MNERIKELIESCGIIPEDEHYEVAELIIHECAIAMSKIPGGYSAEKYYESNKIIKQHFGVK